MTLAEIETALLAKIGAELPWYEVRPYPNKPSGFVLTHPKGAVLVRFAGGRYGQTQAIDAMVQERTIDWEITVVARNLREHGGLYAILDVLRICLTGFKVPGCRKALPIKEEFVSEADGIWQYALWLAVPTVNVERGEDEDLPVLKRLTLIDNFGETEEIP